MKLRFYPRPGHLCSLPGPRVTGALPKYVGRRVRVFGNTIVNAPLDEPAEFDSESREGRRLIRRMIVDRQDQPLWPADPETARACSTAYVPVKRGASGEYEPVVASAKAKSEKGAQ
jgi:hypothetical protein